jgi:hypothetical protein
MASAKSATNQPGGLVIGYLERVSRSVFDRYSDEITELVGNRHGIYALYRNNNLYYVGLARNLKGRVKHHLRDRHAERWDHFSMYLVHSEHCLRDLEALAIRIAYPEGNKMRGKFGGAPDLRKSLEEKLTRRALTEIGGVMGRAPPVTSGEPGKRTKRVRTRRGEPSPFQRVVHEVLQKDGPYVILASRPRWVSFVPESWAKILPDNGTAWRHFTRNISVCCWLAGRPGKVRLVFEVSRMDDPKLRLACVQALRDAGFRVLKSAFRQDAKYSRFFSVAHKVKDFDDTREVQDGVVALLAKAKMQFPKAEAVLRNVFPTP